MDTFTNSKIQARYDGAYFEAFSLDMVEEGTIVDIFEDRLPRRANSTAVRSQDRELSFMDLNASANRVAHAILSRVSSPQNNVALLFDHGSQMIAGLLGVLKTRNAYVPLDPKHPADRLHAIVTNAGCEMVVVSRAHQDLARTLFDASRLIVIEGLEGPDPGNPSILGNPYDRTQIMYTSGSTGRPKGVIHTNRTILHRVMVMTNELKVDRTDRIVLIPSYSVSASTADTFSSLLNGATLLPYAILEQGLGDFAQWLKQEKVSIYHSVPTVFRHFARSIKPGELPDLRIVRLGGEACLVSDVDIYKERLADSCILINRLGSSEGTVAQYQIDKGTVIDGHLVPIGYPPDGVEVQLVDEDGTPAVSGEGEILLRGRYLTAGYWGEEDNQNRFQSDPDDPDVRSYRTGDLGRYNRQGALEYLGRRDYQVKIRGNRVDLSEIEHVLNQVPSVREAVVGVVGSNEAPELCGYLVPESLSQGIDMVSVSQAQVRKLPSYMHLRHFVQLNDIPINALGKIDRQQLPRPLIVSAPLPTESSAEIPTSVEKSILRVWRDILGISDIGVDDSFLALGGDSMLATVASSRLVEAGLRLAPSDIIRSQNVRELAAQTQVIADMPPEQSEPEGQFSLSPSQAWFFDQNFTAYNHWNLGVVLRIIGRPDIRALHVAFDTLVTHHSQLRARFIHTNSSWHQYVDSSARPIDIDIVDMRSVPTEERPDLLDARTRACHAELNISSGPVLRACLFDYGPDMDSELLIVVHHLVFDAYCWGIMIRDLETAYAQALAGKTPTLPERSSTFGTWTQALGQLADSPEILAESNLWETLIARSNARIPTDYELGPNDEASVAVVQRVLDLADTSALSLTAAKLKVGIDTLMLSSLSDVICKWTSSEEVVVLTTHHGRLDQFPGIDVSRTIGWFMTNSPRLLTSPEGNPRDRIERIAREQADVPSRGIGFGLLAHMRSERPAWMSHYHPQMTFNYQGQYDYATSGLRFFQRSNTSRGVTRASSNTRNSLLLNWWSRIFRGQLVVTLRYSRNYHSEGTVNALIDQYTNNLKSTATLL